MADNYIIKATVDEYTKQQYRDAQMAEITALMQQYGLTPGAVTGEYLAEDSVDSIHIKVGAIDAVHISEASITSAAIQNAAIQNAHLGTAVVDTANIADASIKTAKIASGQITTALIGDAQITTAKIGTAQITSATIGDAQITNAKIDRASANKLVVVTADIGDAQITNAKISDASITTAKIQDAQIIGAKIALATIDTANIIDSSITNAKITNLAVDNAKIANLAVDTSKIKDASITTAKIGTAQITTALIADAQITTAKIGSAQITTALIADAQIVNAKIGALAVDNAKIANAAVDTAKIKAASITTALIQDAQITNAKIDRASVNKLVVVTADIGDAQITNAKIDRVSANKLVVGSADIQDASITTAKIGLGQISNALLGTAVVDSANIKDLAVTSAKIYDLVANKITSGTLNTGQVTISGVGGYLKINGNRLQVFDNQAVAVERVSVGDVNNDGTVYGFRVRGADGTTVLYDEQGVYNEGLTNGAVTNPKIADNSIDSRTLVVDAVIAENISAGAITTPKIQVGAITAQSGIIANAAIGTAQIANLAVTNALIGNAEISGGKIANATIEGGNIALATITGSNIVGGTITGALIANATLTGAKIIDGEITTAKIADAQITNAKISSLDATKITTGILDASHVRIGSTTSFDAGFNPSQKRQVFIATPTVPYDIGDLWVQGTTGDIMRCQTAKATGGVYASGDWIKAAKYTDDATANTALNTATAKAKVFNAQPVPPYAIGDVWIQGTSGDILYCTTARSTGTYTSTDWTKASKYTDDTTANAAQSTANTANSTANSVQTLTNGWKYTGTTYIDGGNIYTDTITANQIASNTITATSGILADLAVQTAKIDDLAITNAKIANLAVDNAKISNIDAVKVTTGVLDAGRVRIGSTSTFDTNFDPSSKSRTFTGSTGPVPPYALGDIWVQGTGGDIYHCTTGRTTGVYTSTDWTKSSKYTDDTTANAANSTAGAVQTLTDGWKYPGTTYIDGGDIYANSITANQIQTGIITANSALVASLDASKITVGTLDASKVTVTNLNAGSITSGTLSAITISGGTINGSTFNSNKDASNYLTIQNSTIHAEGTYVGSGYNGYTVMDYSGGQFHLEFGQVNSGVKQMDGQFATDRVGVKVYDPTQVGVGVFISASGEAIGFGDWFDGANRSASVYAMGADLVLDANGVVNIQSKAVLDLGSCVLDLKAGYSQDHVYMAFYADSQAQSTRSGWLGFGSIGNNQMAITNEIGSLALKTGNTIVYTGLYGNYLESPSTGDFYLHRDSDTYLKMADTQFDCYFNAVAGITLSSGTLANTNGNMVVKSNSGYAVLQSNGSGQDLYLQANGVTKSVRPNTTSTYCAHYASAFTVNSERSVKTNIKPTPNGALDLVLKTNIYDYHLIDELNIYGETEDDKPSPVIGKKDRSTVKQRKGMILDEAPQELVFDVGIDLYAMTSMLWKALQELSAEVKTLRQGVNPPIPTH